VIVVAGSRHDPVATGLAKQWRDAALCSAEDLTRPGWIWPSDPGDGPAVWVVDGVVVPDSRVTGVFVRRATVYAEELTATHPDDRAYLAAEAQAFLVYVLHRTAATVVNPVDDGGAFGEAALRPEHWMAVAASLGVEVAPLALRSARRPRPAEAAVLIEVVGTEHVGASAAPLGDAAVAVCAGLGLRWAAVAFDHRDRLTAITTRSRPSDDAAERLARLLADPRAA
jgi:hypothetical protein